MIFGSIFTISVALDYYDKTDMHFVRDMDSALAILDASLTEEQKDINMQVLKSEIGIDIRYLNESQYQSFIQDNQLLDTVDELAVYMTDNERVVLTQRGERFLLLQEAEVQPENFAAIDELEDELDLYALAFIFSCIAITLYMSVRNIAKQVNHLSSASARIAEGQWQTRVNEHIPSPLSKMAESFNHMASSLQYIQNQQQIMANAIAHELRTPLTRMQLALGLLGDTQQDDFTKALHQDINKYTVEMESLANDILMLQTLEHQEVELQVIDISALIASRQHDFQRQFGERQITTQVAAIMLSANTRLVSLILDNLIRNACVYANQKIHIKASITEDKLFIAVSDDGAGIAVEQRQQVLEPFTRLDNSRSRQTGGFGLGLAIVNSVVKKMQGEVSITDSQLGGACFTVCLPYQR